MAAKANHELAEQDYILGMSYADIAAKYAVSINTVKSWKKRYGWSRDKKAKKSAPFAPKNKKGCTPKNRGAPKQAEEETELSDQEQLFCYHYVRTWNATQAAFKAGYASSGNKFSAQVLGSRLLRRPHVAAEVERLRQLFRQEIHVDIQDFLAFCMKVIGADMGDYIRFGMVERVLYDEEGPWKDENGNVIKEPVSMVTLGDSDQLDTSVIQEVKQGKDGISIKLADKKWAWEQVTKYFDWLPDKWQREVESKRLALEERRVELTEKEHNDDDSSNEPVQIVDDIGSDEDAES